MGYTCSVTIKCRGILTHELEDAVVGTVIRTVRHNWCRRDRFSYRIPPIILPPIRSFQVGEARTCADEFWHPPGFDYLFYPLSTLAGHVTLNTNIEDCDYYVYVSSGKNMWGRTRGELLDAAVRLGRLSQPQLGEAPYAWRREDAEGAWGSASECISPCIRDCLFRVVCAIMPVVQPMRLEISDRLINILDPKYEMYREFQWGTHAWQVMQRGFPEKFMKVLRTVPIDIIPD
jgi:hypothetical protein